MNAAVHIACPCCGQALPDRPSAEEMAVALGLSPQETAVLMALARRRGRWMTRDALIDEIYGEAEDGGPDWADGVVRVVVHRLRAKIKGAVVQSSYGHVRIIADRSANGPGSHGGGLGYRVEGLRP